MKKRIGLLPLVLWSILAFLLFTQNTLAQDYKYKTVPNDPLNTRIYTLNN